MPTRYERLTLIDYASRAAHCFPARSRVARELSDWLQTTDLGFDWIADDDFPHARGVPARRWAELRQRLAAARRAHARARPDAFTRNLAELAGYVGLDPAERAVLEVAVAHARGGEAERLLDAIADDAGVSTEDILRCLTGLGRGELRRALRPGGHLVESGLVEIASNRRIRGLRVTAPEPLVAALKPPNRGIGDVSRSLFGAAGRAEVRWEDFDHIGEARDFAARLLEGALASRAAGINVLFYGPPGTGKTELCKVLADRVGATLHAIGETDDEGGEPSPGVRMQQLRLGQRMLAGGQRAVLLFDEMEDLLPCELSMLFGRRSSSRSKVHFNRLLETNPVPTLWTSNSVHRCDPALLRRMTFALELRAPGPRIRERVWERVAKSNRLNLNPATGARLAREFEAPPALVAGAVRAATLCGGSAADLRLAVQAVGKAMRGGREAPPRPLETAPFDERITRADTDLPALTRRLSDPSAPRAVSLCLSGPPGTGKSAYARHLATAMGLPVLQMRTSDLLSKWVGETERLIADAFAEARQEGAFLVFDEADSLLAARGADSRRWEIGQVNEMLTWMESHPLPFACTTNLPGRLDPASLRRFTFKIDFDYLSEAQAALAFTIFFGLPAPARLARLDRLTPGDFATARRKAEVLGLLTPDEIVRLLEQEQSHKPGSASPMGFVARG